MGGVYYNYEFEFTNMNEAYRKCVKIILELKRFKQYYIGVQLI